MFRSKGEEGKAMIYFDHCASTPPHEDVVRTMMEVMTKHYANPSSLHAEGIASAKLIERARELVAKVTGTENGKWIFTSGGTESNNLAIKGIARQYKNRGSHIITTGIEHASVYEVMSELKEEGFTVTFLPTSKSGHIKTEDVIHAITDETILVSIMHVNNEIGTVQPIAEIGEALKSHRKIVFHVDAVQSLGKLPLDIEKWGIDLLSGSAHKIRGPRGVGYLYIRNQIQLNPLQAGGTQEFGLRAGTENVGAIVAAAKALRLAIDKQAQFNKLATTLSTKLKQELNQMDALKLNGAEPQSPFIVHFSYPGMKPEVVIHMLEEKGFLASTRSACSSKDDKPSRVLLEIGSNHQEASGGIRISFGEEHTIEHINQLVQALNDIVVALKPLERSK